MDSLDGRTLVLGVCGGIAAYKAVELCRQLVDAGAHVVPVMTDDATRFIGEVTLSALASEPVRRSLFDDADPIPHTTLGQRADAIVVAPATARLISAYASGYSHDLLTNVLIATRAPVVICPAMHTEMWEHAAVQANLAVLRGRGVHVVEPTEGRLAGGDVGAGRMSEPRVIAESVASVLGSSPAAGDRDLHGLSVLVSAGGTREPLDPVRFIGNRSSGRQGHAIAEVAARRGAEVTLVTASPLEVSAGVVRHDVVTAEEMHRAVSGLADDQDVIIMAAAVADFTPVRPAGSKIKKADGVPVIELRPTVDILAELGAHRREGQTLVGFAAETDDVLGNAREKLARKAVDLLVVNDVTAAGAGFEGGTNEVVILSEGGDEQKIGRTDKARVASAVLDSVLAHRNRARETTHPSAAVNAVEQAEPGEPGATA